MTRRTLSPLAAAFFTLVVAAAGTTSGATQKRVTGIITVVEPNDVTITTMQGNKIVSGRVDAARTKVILDGRPAHASDLRVTYTAKAELGLDDVWSAISATR